MPASWSTRLQTTASVPGFIGFAAGRTTFWDAVADYEGKKATLREATSRIAQRYREWVNVFEWDQASPTLAL
jgi:myo-inositol catabolism protein IolC